MSQWHWHSFLGRPWRPLRRVALCSTSTECYFCSRDPPPPIRAPFNNAAPLGVGGPPPPPPDPPQKIGPNFLPGLQPIKNFLWCLRRQLVQTKIFVWCVQKLSTTRGGGVQGALYTIPAPVDSVFLLPGPTAADCPTVLLLFCTFRRGEDPPPPVPCSTRRSHATHCPNCPAKRCKAPSHMVCAVQQGAVRRPHGWVRPRLCLSAPSTLFTLPSPLPPCLTDIFAVVVLCGVTTIVGLWPSPCSSKTLGLPLSCWASL